jgi:hypothetical protein
MVFLTCEAGGERKAWGAARLCEQTPGKSEVDGRTCEAGDSSGGNAIRCAGARFTGCDTVPNCSWGLLAKPRCTPGFTLATSFAGSVADRNFLSGRKQEVVHLLRR